MGDVYKIIVAHPGKHHSFKLASALKKDVNFQVIYITTVYNKSDSIVMKLIKNLISKSNRQRANSRSNPDLADKEVVQFCQLGGLFEIFLSRYDKKGNLYSAWHKRISAKFGIKVAKYAIKNKVNAVICYDTNALSCFSYLERHAPQISRIMDAAAASWVYMKEIYELDMQQNPRFAEKLKEEIGNYINDRHQGYSKKEIASSNYILTASNFVKNSYRCSGINAKRIAVCPYGVDLKDFPYKEREIKSNNEIINFVFTGGTKQLKGISYLLDAFLHIPIEKASLTIIGKCNLREEILEQYQNRVHFTGTVLQSEVSEILQEMDVMIFPSLGDGFGLSAIEAMSCGCPLICSENSGIADLVNEGDNGFVIPIQDVDAIIERVKWFIHHRELIPYMGKKAHETAIKYTWQRYNNTVSDVVKKFVEM
ncbi:glycosyltransferase family 4 protein [Bacillus infantis]|uniref:glycosyltransferase family 4 protein n=1 Tax=Bacillus infantis TaxID=324767 RepID=UPI003982AB82